MLAREFGSWPVQLHTHSPQALRVSVLAEMEKRFPEEFSRTRRGRFRAADDIAVTGFLFHHYAFMTGRGVTVPARTQLIQQNHNFEKLFERLLLERDAWGGSPKLSFCVNDGRGSLENDVWNNAASEFLIRYFPVKSQFEK